MLFITKGSIYHIKHNVHTTFCHGRGLTWNLTFNESIYYVSYLQILRSYLVWQLFISFASPLSCVRRVYLFYTLQNVVLFSALNYSLANRQASFILPLAVCYITQEIIDFPYREYYEFGILPWFIVRYSLHDKVGLSCWSSCISSSSYIRDSR